LMVFGHLQFLVKSMKEDTIIHNGVAYTMNSAEAQRARMWIALVKSKWF
jgi:hypothetical protein